MGTMQTSNDAILNPPPHPVPAGAGRRAAPPREPRRSPLACVLPRAAHVDEALLYPGRYYGPWRTMECSLAFCRVGRRAALHRGRAGREGAASPYHWRQFPDGRHATRGAVPNAHDQKAVHPFGGTSKAGCRSGQPRRLPKLAAYHDQKARLAAGDSLGPTEGRLLWTAGTPRYSTDKSVGRPLNGSVASADHGFFGRRSADATGGPIISQRSSRSTQGRRISGAVIFGRRPLRTRHDR